MSHPENADRILQFSEPFDTPGWWERWSFTSRPPNTYTGTDSQRHSRRLRVNWLIGQHYGTSFEFKFREQGHDEPTTLQFTYDIKFGLSFTGAGKLPGFGGTYGRAGWGRRRSTGADGWSARVGFNARNANYVRLYYYVYHVDQPNSTGQGLGYFQHEGTILNFRRDQWYRITGACTLNTPNAANGTLVAMIDGAPAFEARRLRFRTTDDLKIESFWFDCYHGGDSDPSPVDMDAFFDNIKLAWPAA